MGVAGVALGGSSAASLVTLVFVTLWWRGRFNLKPLKRLSIDWVGNAPASRHRRALSCSSRLWCSWHSWLFFAIVAQYGTYAYAAYGIGISLVSFPIVVGFGFGIAAATLVGQQLGAGRPRPGCRSGVALPAYGRGSNDAAFNAAGLARTRPGELHDR